MDFTQVSGCTRQARESLAILQRALADRRVRTAFIASRPRYRGLALWIAHVAEDPNARSFHVRAQAEDWLSSRQTRTEKLIEDLGRPSWNRRTRSETTPSGRLRRMRLKSLARKKDSAKKDSAKKDSET